jgi:dienelactone hydrolase
MKRNYIAGFGILFLAAAGVVPAQGQQKALASFWGSLSAGSYAVGFKTIYQFDRTRTWRTTRAYEEPFAPDLNGRPIRVSVWYPAIRDARSRQIRFEDYVKPSGPKEFAELNSILEYREKTFGSFRVPPGRWADLMATSMSAYADAPPIGGRFPLLLYAAGLNNTSTSTLSVLGEFLASHGYIVATVALLGPSNEQTEQGRMPSDRERTVQDLEFAWSLLRGQPDVDEAKTGVFGHSLGAIEALIFAMRNANVCAVIGLDGTYGFKGLGTVLSELADYAPRRMHAAFLDIRRDWKDLDLSAEHAFHYSDRSFIKIKKMHHVDFQAYTMVAFELNLALAPGEADDSGWTRETGYRGFQDASRMVLDFFDKTLKGDQSGAERLRADVARAGGVLTHDEALAPPPSGGDFIKLIGRHGFDSAAAIVDRYRRAIPDEPVVDPDACNGLGYRLIAEGRFPEAIGILRLILYAYPNSANAADSLADAYIAAGQKELARASLQQALRLIPADSSLNEAAKQSMAKTEQAKLDQLQP